MKKANPPRSRGQKMQHVMPPVHGLSLSKNRSGARFATWLNEAVFLAMIPQSVSVFVLEPGYTKHGNWDPRD